MSSLMRNLGSLVRGESSYSNEQDPWESEAPMSFQSVRRESRAKPPGSFRNPRGFTLPNLLSLRSHIRNRSNDSEYVPYSPDLSRAPPFSSPRSVTPGRERVVDDHNMTEEIPPAIMARSFIRPSNRTTGSPVVEPTSLLKKRSTIGHQKSRSRQNETGADVQKGRGLGDIPPLSPVSEEADYEDERSSRRNWIRGRVRRVFRLGRRERPQV